RLRHERAVPAEAAEVAGELAADDVERLAVDARGVLGEDLGAPLIEHAHERLGLDRAVETAGDEGSGQEGDEQHTGSGHGVTSGTDRADLSASRSAIKIRGRTTRRF